MRSWRQLLALLRFACFQQQFQIVRLPLERGVNGILRFLYVLFTHQTTCQLWQGKIGFTLYHPFKHLTKNTFYLILFNRGNIHAVSILSVQMQCPLIYKDRIGSHVSIPFCFYSLTSVCLWLSHQPTSWPSGVWPGWAGSDPWPFAAFPPPLSPLSCFPSTIKGQK